jgi:hypothetical protein
MPTPSNPHAAHLQHDDTGMQKDDDDSSDRGIHGSEVVFYRVRTKETVAGARAVRITPPS